MSHRPVLSTLSVVFALALLAAGCSSDDDSADPPVDEAEQGATTPDPPDGDATEDPLVVETDLGTLAGTESDVDGVRAFLAVPYAAPPVGDGRFAEPMPYEPWDGERLADAPGAACPQSADNLLAEILITPDSDEDCLTLNVWAPEDAEDLPVMVWVHGGGLTSGSAHQPYYIGDQLAERGVVLVSMNYRLGAFGFLATEELADESDDGSFGNYGLADQVAALEWVQRNVEAFGGDPDDVTLFGESAGGFSVCGHLASPASQGLFDRVSILSGGGCDRLQPAEDAFAAGDGLLEETGCEDVACLRDLSPEELLDAPFSAVLVADGVRLDTTARQLAADGELDVAALIGSNADEATLFTIGMDEPDEAELLGLVGTVSDDAEAVLALYPSEAFESNLARYQAVFNDARFTCPALDFAALLEDSYVYHYTYISPGNPFGLGATHGAELAFLFGHPEGIAGLDAQRDESTEQVAEDIQSAWTEFAIGGIPRPDWPTFASRGQIMELNAPFAVVDEIRDGRCESLMPLVASR